MMFSPRLSFFWRTFFAFVLCLRVCAAPSEPEPDYTQETAWAAFPGRANHADEQPAGVQHDAQVQADVFFIHPTSFLLTSISNAAYDARLPSEVVDFAILRFQASAFNDCCRIYAPRYRQASLGAITSDSEAAQAANALAYADVLSAFHYFLQQIGTRPFILAGHSQGSIHGMRLLQQEIMGTPLQRRLIAAYLPGNSLPQAITQQGITVCNDARATGCVLSWNSVREGYLDPWRIQKEIVWWEGRYQPIGGRPIICVNPLTWEENGNAPASANLGAVYNAGRTQPIPAPVPELTAARCKDNLLGVHPTEAGSRHFENFLTNSGSFHVFDYGLFYMNIRANAKLRVASYLAQQH